MAQNGGQNFSEVLVVIDNQNTLHRHRPLALRPADLLEALTLRVTRCSSREVPCGVDDGRTGKLSLSAALSDPFLNFLEDVGDVEGQMVRRLPPPL